MTCRAVMGQVPKQPGGKRNVFGRCLQLSSAIHTRQIRGRKVLEGPYHSNKEMTFSNHYITPRALCHLGGFPYWMLRGQRKVTNPQYQESPPGSTTLCLLLLYTYLRLLLQLACSPQLRTPFCPAVEEYPTSDKTADVIFQLSHWP